MHFINNTLFLKTDWQENQDVHISMNENEQSLFSNGRLLNVNKILDIFRGLKPLTLSYQDIEGNKLQIWKTDQYGMIGSVLKPDGQLKIVKSSKIFNPLIQINQKNNLLSRLENITLRTWNIVYDSNKMELTLWPHLIANGKYDHIPRGSSFQNLLKKFSSLQSAQNDAAKDVTLPDGRIRYYDKERLARNPGRTRGNCSVTEYNPKTGRIRLWVEDHDHKGNVTQVHPKMIDGKDVDLPHYRSIFKENSQGKSKDNFSKTPANKEFEQKLQQTKLTESFNSTHRHNPVQAKAGTGGEIGGVACSTDYIEGLFDSVESLFEQDHIFCVPQLPDGKIPFTNLELRQILRELAIGVYVHSTIPFFSLHFNQNSDQFPIVHPAYENTLVGRVIGLLDYFMKGYLNGGVFQEDFIDKWNSDPSWKNKSGSALQNLIDFESYCKKELNGDDQQYKSLRELQYESGLLLGDSELLTSMEKLLSKFQEEVLGVYPESSILKDFSGFQSSFRIIAKQNSIQKEGNVFVIDADFDVLYTMNPSPEYKESMEQYFRKSGVYPPSYMKLEHTYQLICEKIKNHMIKMPLCRDYFAMLSVINFFSGYFSTLKKHRKVPELPSFEIKDVKGCPSLFPHLPVNKTCHEPLKFNRQKFYVKLIKNHRVILEQSLAELLNQVIHSSDPGTSDQVANKNALLEIFKNCVDETVLDLCSPSFQRYCKIILKLVLPEQEKLTSISSLILENFINSFKQYIDDPYAKLIESKTITSSFLNILSNQIQKDIVFATVAFNTARMKSEIDDSEVKNGKKIVGGCGMELHVQTVKSSQQATNLFYNNAKKMMSLSPESWEEINFDSEKKTQGHVFKLSHQDAPAWSNDNYAWMESFLLVDKESDGEPTKTRTLILEAIFSEDKNAFSTLINQQIDLSTLNDKYRITLLHHAATMTDPFYVEALLSKKLSPLQEDIYGYLPIHYAAMSGALETMQCLLVGDIMGRMLNALSHHGTTPLIVSIQNNQIATTSWLISQNALITTSSGGYNTFHCALHQGNHAIINEMLNHKSLFGSLINEMSEEGGTPLMLACELDSLSLVERIINKGGIPTAKRKDGMTAIEIAIKRNSGPILEYLLKLTSPSGHAIEEAAMKGSVDTMKLLMAKNKNEVLAHKNTCEDNVFHMAIRKGNIPVALFLIKNCDDSKYLCAVNMELETPFSLVASLGAWTLLDELLKKTAITTDQLTSNVQNLLRHDYQPVLKTIFNQINPDKKLLQKYLLQAAQCGNNLAISQLFIPKGANLDALLGPNDWTIMHYLAKSDGLYLFKRIILKINNVLQPLAKEDGKTLAYIAAEHRSVRVFSLLLEVMKKKKILLSNHFKDRHLLYAVVESGNEECLNAMIRTFHETDLINEVLDDAGTCSVHLVAKNGSESLIKLLASKGAKFDVKDKQGFTPLCYAVQAGANEIVSYLIKDLKVKITSHALYAAVSQQDKTNISLLIQRNKSSKKLNRALLLAVYAHDKTAIEMLVKFGATYDYVSKRGWTALLFSSASGQHEILSLILEKNTIKTSSLASVNPLHLACKNRHPHCVKLLIDAGYNDEENHEGFTAKFLAKGNVFIESLLEGKQDPYQKQITDFLTALEKEEQSSESSLNSVQQGIEDLFKNFLQISKQDEPSKLILLMDALPINETLLFKIEGKPFWATLPQFLIKISGTKNTRPLLETLLKNPHLNLGIQNDEGNTLVHLFIQMGLSLPDIQERQLTIKNHQGETPFHFAAAYAKPEVLEALLKVSDPSIGINSTDNGGMTPIFHAIRAKNNENVQILIQNGADLSHYTHQRVTPLMCACKMKSLSIFKLLINEGADINQEMSIHRISPIHFTIVLNEDEMTRQLIFKGVNCNSISSAGLRPVHIASEVGKTSLIHLFASKGISLNSKDSKGLQPIHHAASYGKLDMMKTLQAIDPESVDFPIEPEETEDNKINPWTGATPLHLSAFNDQSEPLDFLLHQKINVETLTKYKQSVLSFAASAPSTSGLEKLYPYKLSKNPDYLCPAIIQAIHKDNVDSLKSLYKQGVPMNADLENKSTGLHIASKYGAIQCTQWLLKNGSSPWHIESEGKDVFEISAANNSYEQFRLLLEFEQPDLDREKSHGARLLHISAKAGNLKHVALLLKLGASVDVVDDSECTPLHYAIKAKQPAIVALLLSCGADLEDKNSRDQNAFDILDADDIETKQVIELHQKSLEEAKEGESFLHLAVRNQNTLAVLLFKDLVNIDQQNSEGVSALHLAAQTKQKTVIIHLIRAGANINLQDAQGNTPLRHASDSATAELLVHAGAIFQQ